MEFTDILDRHRIEYDNSGRNKSRSGWVNCRCPQCGKWPYLGFCVSSRAFSCWSCGRLGLSETLQSLTGLSASEVYALIGELPREEPALKQIKHRGKLELPVGLGPLGPAHKAYLRGRGFDPDVLVRLWKIQGIGHLGGGLAWRIFIPCYLNNEIISWTTRSLKNEGMRYIDAKPNQSIVPLKNSLYGLDYCRASVILVEGCTDVWAIGPGAAACFGLRLSPGQRETLSRFPLRVVCFDSGHDEKAAEKRADQLCRDLSVFDGRTIRVRLESAKDAGSASRLEVKELRERFLK